MKRGRPNVDPGQPSTAVHLKLSALDYDRADRLRQQNRDRSIQDVIRRGLKQILETENRK